MTRESTVQVSGSLNTPAYQWPLRAGVICCVLSPVALALRRAGRRRWGRFRGIVMLLRYLGPVFLLGTGLAGLAFAMAIRQILAARRLDLEIGPGGFALIDRRGRREFADSAVVALGFRSRSEPGVPASTRRGRASVWVETREGPERIDLAWEYPQDGDDPMAGLLGRLADQVHARAVRSIDSGGTISGEGWEVSRLGLQVGESFDIIPFADIAKAEYHDGRLKVWKPGQAEPAVEIPEGSKDDAILHAILVERIPEDHPPVLSAGPTGPGLGRLLFERRATRADRAGLWLLGAILASAFLALGFIHHQLGRDSSQSFGLAAVGFLGFLPALMRQVRVFRFHERGVASSGLLGTRELSFGDLERARVLPASTTSMMTVGFEPIPGRGRKKVVLLTRIDDDALESIRAYVGDRLTFG